ncbi:MAG: Nucleotidyltransferase/DNA polymerase involved in repair, partial [Clostridia bacterium]|nr:Nucleotidyltransferase/DNA polymerase involved in repair [Clostridia bacterium]
MIVRWGEIMQQKKERVIFHSDLNSYYASVEVMENPELRDKPIAVCGSREERHGIVLAKSEPAKKCGVKTGEAIWQAKMKCKNLIIIEPHYDKYIKYSKMAREIYNRYTDLIEPFGIDECWLDVSGSIHLFGNGYDLAYKIKEEIKNEIGITVSIGVSYNKIFAKLGSDMKKPDAITCISSNDFKEKVWSLPASDILGVGYATEKKLNRYEINTIGSIAACPSNFLVNLFGKNGYALWAAANGLDTSEVHPNEEYVPIKSIGHGMTALADLENNTEVNNMIMELSQDVAKRLRENNLSARRLQISVRDNKLFNKEYQTTLDYPTQSFKELSECAYKLFYKNYQWQNKIRSMTVRAINLIPEGLPYQTDFFINVEKREKNDKLERAMENIRSRFGYDSVQ